MSEGRPLHPREREKSVGTREFSSVVCDSSKLKKKIVKINLGLYMSITGI